MLQYYICNPHLWMFALRLTKQQKSVTKLGLQHVEGKEGVLLFNHDANVDAEQLHDLVAVHVSRIC